MQKHATQSISDLKVTKESEGRQPRHNSRSDLLLIPHYHVTWSWLGVGGEIKTDMH